MYISGLTRAAPNSKPATSKAKELRLTPSRPTERRKGDAHDEEEDPRPGAAQRGRRERASGERVRREEEAEERPTGPRASERAASV